MKNVFEGLIHRLDMAEETISELEYMARVVLFMAL